jgi:hypothetical protein
MTTMSARRSTGTATATWSGRFSADQKYPRRTTKASRDLMQAVYPRIGAVVIGRRLFDHTDGWGGVLAAGDHVLVVTHAPRTDWEHPGTAPFTFVTDGVEAAIAQARELAGADRDVDVAAGEIGGSLGSPGGFVSESRSTGSSPEQKSDIILRRRPHPQLPALAVLTPAGPPPRPRDHRPYPTLLRRRPAEARAGRGR